MSAARTWWEFALTLERAFDPQRDEILWDAELCDLRDAALLQSGAARDGALQHQVVAESEGAGSAAARLIAAIGMASARASLGQPDWVVAVVPGSAVQPVCLAQPWQGLQQAKGRLLLVVCDVAAAEASGGGADWPNAMVQMRSLQFAEQAQIEYLGPFSTADVNLLREALGRIKQQVRQAILHVRMENRSPAEPSAAAPAVLPRASLHDVSTASYRLAASAAAARCARTDPRVVAVDLVNSPAWAQEWAAMPDRVFRVHAEHAHALAWCSGLANGGCRPVVFLSGGTLRSEFGAVDKLLAVEQAPVTLIVEAADDLLEDRGGDPPEAGFGLMRLLPDAAILSPKNAEELERMVEWSLAQDGPTVVWLPDRVAAEMSWDPASSVQRGRAELLTQGNHVALVAFGPLVGAAYLAAKILAEDGVQATVVNARFAAPLDSRAIVDSVRQALCAVIVDSQSAGGGFANLILELLAAEGVTQPVSVVKPDDPCQTDDPYVVQQACIWKIVERCRWLSEGVEDSMARLAPSEAASAEPDVRGTRAAGGWLALAGDCAGPRPDDHQQVLTLQLTPTIEGWVAQYAEVGSRDLYLWRWCMHGARITTLPCVLAALGEHVCETKLLSIILCVLFDDVADEHGDSRLLEALLSVVGHRPAVSLSGLTAADRAHVRITRRLWAEYQTRVAGYPRHGEFADLLRYDLAQFFNAMRYSHLVNCQPSLLNLAEHDLYSSHNMQIISFSTLDLMCSPDFPIADLGKLREAIWHAQSMGRIGNLLSTWRREIPEHDFTSGVFARALAEDHLTVDELIAGNPQQIERVIRHGGHENYFIRRWQYHRQCFLAKARQIRSVRLDGVLDGHERFLHMHLGSQGRI